MKPATLTRPKILQFGLALVAKGMFDPIYKTAEEVFGVDQTSEIFKWILSAKDAVENPPAVNPTPPAAPDTITADILSGAIWGPKKEGKPETAKIVCTMTDVRLQAPGIRWKDDKPSRWPIKLVGKDKTRCIAVLYVAVQRNGKWQVSKFDWLREPDQEEKNLHNIQKNYEGLSIRSGERVCFVIASTDGKER